MKNLAAIYFFAALLIMHTAQGQDRLLTAIDSQAQRPSEKIYILYDKTDYVAGESVWFSAFIFSGYQPSKLSTNIYIDFYNHSKKLIIRKRFPVFNGCAGGQFLLPRDLPEDVYYVHAYTQWLLNFSDDVQYLHRVPVLNPKSPMVLQKKDSIQEAMVFAEGGNIIDNIPTKISLHVSGKAFWTADLVDSTTSIVLSKFQKINGELALTTFNPLVGHQYRALISDSSGNIKALDLPFVRDSGLHLETHALSDSIKYTLICKGIETSLDSCVVLASINNTLVYKAIIKKPAGIVEQKIPISNLANGILRIAVVGSNDSVLAERLCFLNTKSRNRSHFQIENANFRPGEKSINSFNFATDSLDGPCVIEVLDGREDSSCPDNNLYSAVWLNNDITDPVNNAGFYFTENGQANEAAIDALLIGEHWKWFSWNDILHDRFQKISYEPDNYLYVAGRVILNKKVLRNRELNLSFYSNDTTMQFTQITTDTAGRFKVSHLLFYDSVKVAYQLNGESPTLKNLNVEHEDWPLLPALSLDISSSNYALVPRNLTSQPSDKVVRALNTINQLDSGDSKYKKLPPVTVHSLHTEKDKLNLALSSIEFRGADETIFDFIHTDNHPEMYSNILEWLVSRVPGMELKQNDDGYMIPYFRKSPGQIYLNENPIDARYLYEIQNTEITMIKVEKGYLPGAIGSGNGAAVLIYTTHPKGENDTRSALANTFYVRGYDAIENYPLPDYSDLTAHAAEKDTRFVLYWNAFNVADKKHNTIGIRFYNNDDAKTYRIIAAAIADDGTPIFSDTFIEIK